MTPDPLPVLAQRANQLLDRKDYAAALTLYYICAALARQRFERARETGLLELAAKCADVVIGLAPEIAWR